MVTRRGFLGMLAGAVAAPAIVKAENLMKIFVPKQEIFVPLYPNEFGMRGIGADFDGDCISLSNVNEELCRQLGISPELFRRDTKLWSSAEIVMRNNQRLAVMLTEMREKRVVRYPITSSRSIVRLPPKPQVKALVANDFKNYW